MAITSDGTVYAGTVTANGSGKIYIKNISELSFSEIQGVSNSVTSLIITPNKDIYAGTWNNWSDTDIKGKLYKKN